MAKCHTELLKSIAIDFIVFFAEKAQGRAIGPVQILGLTLLSDFRCLTIRWTCRSAHGWF